MKMAIAFALVILASCASAPSSTSDGAIAVAAASENFATTPDGVRLYYRSIGVGDDVVIAPFALYHGAAFDALAKGRRIVTYDPRGRGRSDPAPKDALSLDHLLVDFETIRLAVGAERVSIIGWSGAGMEMFVYALRNPARVNVLVQLAPVAARFDPYGGMMMDDRARRTDAAAQADYMRRVNAGEFNENAAAQCRAEAAITLPPLLADPADAEHIPDACVFENEHPDRIGAYFGKLFGTIIGYDWRDDLANAPARRLVIHGASDNTPFEGNREWVAGQTNARILVIENAGHFPHYEQIVLTLSAIDAFLDGGWPGDAVAIP